MTERDRGVATLPMFALRALTPTPREGARISLYRVVCETDVPRVAAAWWLMQKDPFALIALDEAVLRAAGAVLHDDVVGDTYHPSVNDAHVDLEVKTGDDAIKFAKLFFQHGELLPVEPKEIRTSIANDNSEDLVDFAKLTKEKKSPAPNNLCDLIHDKALVLRKP